MTLGLSSWGVLVRLVGLEKRDTLRFVLWLHRTRVSICYGDFAGESCACLASKRAFGRRGQCGRLDAFLFPLGKRRGTLFSESACAEKCTVAYI